MPYQACVLVSTLLLGPIGQVPLPGTSSVTVGLAPPFACRKCHGVFEMRTAYESWAGSAMGHSARDPLFLSALSEAEKDLPGVGDFCLRCHAPAAWLEGRCIPTDGSALEDDDSGVTCAFCHRSQESAAIRSGQYVVADDETYRGPYDDATAPHRNQESAWISDSRMCGTCHDLWNPLVERKDLDGTPMGMRFAEQTTYTEWASSVFASGPQMKTCQGCHMPDDEGRVAQMGPIRPDRSLHGFAGGNAFVLGAIGFLEPGLGLAAQLAAGQARAGAMLQTAAAVEIEDKPMQVARGETFRVVYRITNLTGHKLPTGYPEGRRVWLSAKSEPIGFDRGAFDELTGEPDSPLAIYHVRQGQHGIGPGIHLALNDTVFEDTRIPPQGMVVTATTAPVGKTYPEVSPGVLAHYDLVGFDLTAPCEASISAIPLSASLWYQSVTKAYVDALVSANGMDPRGGRLAIAFEEADPGPFEMAKLEVEIAIDPASSCDPPDAGAGDDAESTDGRSDDASVPDSGGRIDAGQTVQPADDGGCACASTAHGVDGAGAAGLIVLMIFAGWRKRSRG